MKYSFAMASKGYEFHQNRAGTRGNCLYIDEERLNLICLLGGQPTFACQYDPCKMSSSLEAMGIETGPSA